MSEKNEQKPKKVFVFDFMAMAFRYHHALQKQPFFTSLGFPTSSIFGVVRALYRIFEKESPDYMIVASDSKEPTFRHELYKEYKAHRTQMPEELEEQIPKLFELFHILNIPVIIQPKMEADDIIATLVQDIIQEYPFEVYIVTNDKDMMQLVSERVKLYQTLAYNGQVRIVGEKDVEEYFCVPPSQVTHAQALIGDSSDNVPGVVGVGKVTAGKLLNTYGSLNGIYANLHEITLKNLRLNLEKDRENAFLSQKLVTLRQDLDISWSLEDAKVCKKDWSDSNHRLDEFLLCCEFRSLRKKYFPLSKRTHYPVPFSPMGSQPSKESSLNKVIGMESSSDFVESHDDANVRLENGEMPVNPWHFPLDHFQAMEDLSDYDWLINQAKEAKCMVMSFMMSQTKSHVGFASLKAHGFVLCFIGKNQNISGYYLNASGDNEKAKTTFFLNFCKAFFVASPCSVVMFDVKAHMHALKNMDKKAFRCLEDAICRGVFIDDLMIMGCLSEDFAPHPTLKKTISEYLPSHPQTIQWMLGVYESYMPYDGDDPLAIQRINHFFCLLTDVYAGWFLTFERKLEECGLQQVYSEVERPLVVVLVAMERKGIYLHRQALAEYSKKLAKDKAVLAKDIYALAGEEFNIQSPKQLAHILFEKLCLQKELKLPSKVYKGSSGYSTRESVLEAMREAPIASAVLRYRKIAKLKGTYTDGLAKFIDPFTSRVHSTFCQCGTVTGRMSSMDPNLQNIPIRSEMASEIRRAFCASREDYVIISADYSQIELRVLAHMSKDENLRKAFDSGEDIHNWTASVMFGKDLAEVTKHDRNIAKAINYGIIYGMGPKKLAKIISVSFVKAKSLIESYFKHFAKVAEFNIAAVEFARSYGYSKTITGRRRAIENINSSSPMLRANAENMARNSPIQGSAADLMKLAMILVYRRIQATPTSLAMMVQVHDELVFECSKEDLAASLVLIKEAMEGAMALDVPIEVSIGHGSNWLEAH